MRIAPFTKPLIGTLQSGDAFVGMLIQESLPYCMSTNPADLRGVLVCITQGRQLTLKRKDIKDWQEFDVEKIKRLYRKCGDDALYSQLRNIVRVPSIGIELSTHET